MKRWQFPLKIFEALETTKRSFGRGGAMEETLCGFSL
jgi:hypothetical protein